MSEFVVKEFTDLTPLVDYRKRTVELVVSTPDLDRDGEIVAPRAFEKDIDSYIGTPHSNPILILSHVHKSMPVGKCIEMRFDDEYTWAKYWLSKTQAGEETLTLFKEGVLKGCSPGFIPIVFYDNPSPAKLPKLSLKTLNGRRCKRLYERCELVEVSALAIPSNRKAVVSMAEKGNSVAGLVVKMFDARMAGHSEQLPLIIKEWIDEYTAKTGFGEFVEKGLFTDCPEMVTKGAILQAGINEAPKIWHYMFMPGSEGVPTENQQTNQRLDQMIGQQQQMIEQLQAANDKDSWTNWAKTWGTRLGIAGAAYLFFNKTNLGQAMKDRAKQHVYDWAVNRFPKTLSRFKGAKENEALDAVKMLTDAIDILGLSLEKGKELGLENTKLYKDLATKYGELTDEIHDLVLNKGFAIDFSDFVIKEPSDITEEVGSGFSAFIAKEMSKEEFREPEHPRNQDGTFRKKNTAAKASRPKGAHGGKREGAGRLPSQANLAVEARRMQYKKQFPGATDQEVDSKIREDAAKLRKPDWVAYMDNPVEYQKEQARQMEDALRSKYNKTYSRGQRIVIKDNAVLDAVVERARVAETQAKFEKDVVKARAMGDAYATLSDEDASQMEKSNAKLLLGVGFIASTLGLAALMIGRPNWRRAGIKVIRGLERAPEKLAAGAGEVVRPLKATSTTEGTRYGVSSLYVEDTPRLFSFKQITNAEYANPAGFTERARNLIGTAIQKLRPETKNIPDKWTISGGAHWEGFRGRHRFTDTHFVAKYTGEARDEAGRLINKDAKNLYVPRKGDVDAITGTVFVDRQGKVDWLALLTAHSKTAEINGVTPLVGRGLDTKLPMMWTKLDGGRFIYREKANERELIKYLVKRKLITKSSTGYEILDKRLIPDYVYQKFDKAEIQERATAIKMHRGWGPFFDQRFAKVIPRKILSGIAATGAIGTGTAYYFHQDIASFTDARIAERNRLEKLEAESVPTTSGKDPVVAQLVEERRLVMAQAKADDMATKRDRVERQSNGTQYTDEELVAMSETLSPDKHTPAMVAANKRLYGKAKGIETDLVTKAPVVESDDDYLDVPSLDDIATTIAFDMCSQIEDVSQSCKMVIESGMPGHTQWEELNNLVESLYVALREKAKEEPIKKGFSEFVTKEMTAEQFREEEHKRANDGKFAKVASGGATTQKKKIDSDGDSNLGYKIAAGLGAVALTVGAYKLLKGSNIWKVSGGSQKKAKVIVEDLLSVAAPSRVVSETKQSAKIAASSGEVKPNAKIAVSSGEASKGARHIINLKISDHVTPSDLSNMSPKAKDFYSYLKDPKQMTKDIMSQFGHLEYVGAEEIKVTPKFDFGTEDISDRVSNLIGYSPVGNKINVNFEMLEFMEQGGLLKEFSPKSIMMHEYAHSLTFTNQKLVLDYSKQYLTECRKLIGKTLHVEGPGPLLGDFKINDIEMETYPAVAAYTDGLAQLAKEGELTFNQSAFSDLKKKFSAINHAQLVLKTTDSAGNEKRLTLIEEFLKAGMKEGGLPQRDFKIPGVGEREIYGLTSISEYIAVLAEKGVRL